MTKPIILNTKRTKAAANEYTSPRNLHYYNKKNHIYDPES